MHVFLYLRKVYKKNLFHNANNPFINDLKSSNPFMYSQIREIELICKNKIIPLGKNDRPTKRNRVILIKKKLTPFLVTLHASY